MPSGEGQSHHTEADESFVISVRHDGVVQDS
jgi:hypothetical protein